MGMRELARAVAATTGSPRVLSVDDIQTFMRNDAANNRDADRSTMTADEAHAMISRYQGWPGNDIIRNQVMGFDANEDGRLNASEVYAALSSRRGDVARWGLELRRRESSPLPEDSPRASGVSLRRGRR